MQRIAKFTHVSQGQFEKDFCRLFPGAQTAPEVTSVPLPRRATRGSAGYDFFSPVSFSLAAGAQILIPTGVRAQMEAGWVLAIFPRSGLGVRYRFRLNNSAGIIDQDYAFSENEGHILLSMTNESLEGKTLSIEAGKAIAQGIFLPFGLTQDDSAGAPRNGGFGSTERGG